MDRALDALFFFGAKTQMVVVPHIVGLHETWRDGVIVFPEAPTARHRVCFSEQDYMWYYR